MTDSESLMDCGGILLFFIIVFYFLFCNILFIFFKSKIWNL